MSIILSSNGLFISVKVTKRLECIDYVVTDSILLDMFKRFALDFKKHSEEDLVHHIKVTNKLPLARVINECVIELFFFLIYCTGLT